MRGLARLLDQLRRAARALHLVLLRLAALRRLGVLRIGHGRERGGERLRRRIEIRGRGALVLGRRRDQRVREHRIVRAERERRGEPDRRLREPPSRGPQRRERERRLHVEPLYRGHRATPCELDAGLVAAVALEREPAADDLAQRERVIDRARRAESRGAASTTGVNQRRGHHREPHAREDPRANEPERMFCGLWTRADVATSTQTRGSASTARSPPRGVERIAPERKLHECPVHTHKTSVDARSSSRAIDVPSRP